MKVLALFLLVLILVGLSIWYEVAVWQECRLTNSFMYCLRILSK